ncbi:uncharacterized protein N7459_002130 [Penicillium hispanicum]|uniref:uncharacterized protein n=1 Tax=Penicillium hispanicum TaxID=1080232 RepID=UPI0025405DB2|nr:uncharacterized protein N7459_002130 [Penicillium hispanicum]KAJ5591761.1 hypothetical protein N7459_002130 [Penicillium hispanicum]
MNQSSDDVATSKPTSSPDSGLSPETPSRDNTLDKPSLSHTALSRDFLDFTLNFLSESNNETIVGVFILLAIVIYIILGRIGLLIIGVVLGILLHASWEGTTYEDKDHKSQVSRKRRELALEVSQRLLDWPKRAAVTELVDKGGTILAASEKLSATDLEYATFQPATAAALTAITDAVIGDYVKYWYEPILPSECIFPGSCRRTLTHFVTAVASHLSRKRTEDTFLQFLTNSSSIIIVFLNELAGAFSSVGASSTEAKKTIDQYLENFPESSLANVLSEEQQQKKLNMIADDILSNFLDPKAYSCSPVRDFLREVFAGLILEPTITNLSRPEFINEWIIYLLEDGESEIMHAIDAGVEGARNQGVSAPKVSEDTHGILLESTKSEAASEAVVNQIGHTDRATEDALREAKRLSALIASQDLQSTSPEPIILDGQHNDTQTSNASQIAQSARHTASDDNSWAASVMNEGSASGFQQATPLPMPPTTQATKISHEGILAPPVILHGAQIMVDDDGAASEKGVIRSRPTWDYLLQIEPTSTRSTGWMVFRKYSDFQSLHGILETVSRLNRIHSFSEQFPTLPAWKGKTRQSLARDLERYLQEAMKHETLAETDRMRRFLEKQSGPSEVSIAKPGFSFPSQTAFENMGKGVLDALTSAPKGVAGGSRAVFDGVTGVFGGGVGSARKPTQGSEPPSQDRKSSSKSNCEILESVDSTAYLNRADSSPTDRRLGDRSIGSGSSERPGSPVAVPSPTVSSLGAPKVEAPKSSISDSGRGTNTGGSEQDVRSSASTRASPEHLTLPEPDGYAEGIDARESMDSTSPHAGQDTEPRGGVKSISQGGHRPQQPITADETRIAVELIFAVINELYTLSSAWNIRRTLLNAAKSYILRPGSPILETIRTLLQGSMIENHTSDKALGDYLAKLRENALPTEAELKAWPPSPSEQEKMQLHDTARRLFVQRGIPQALTSVMGTAASREALEKIFDSLQVETVARGFVFSVLLQGLRVLTL